MLQGLISIGIVVFYFAVTSGTIYMWYSDMIKELKNREYHKLWHVSAIIGVGSLLICSVMFMDWIGEGDLRYPITYCTTVLVGLLPPLCMSIMRLFTHN